MPKLNRHSTRPAMRRDVVVVTVGALGLTLASCSSKSSSSSTSGTTPSPTSAVQLVDTTPAAKGPLDSLTWDLPLGEPTTLDYVKAADYSPDMVISNLCESLLRLNPDYTMSPNLATAWKTSDDHLTTTFTLRSDVTFWDGKPMTSQDVVYSLKRNLDPNNGPVNGAFFDHVKSITATSPTEVVVTFNTPDELFIQEMSTIAGDVSEQAFTEAQGEKYGSAEGGVMCTGPFKIESWNAGQNIVLAANDAYWNASNKALAKKVTLSFITDTSTLVQALKSGEIQGTYETPQAALPALTNADSGTVYQGQSLQVIELVPNSPGPAADPKIREALGMVIDRAALAKAVFHGTAEPNYTLIPNAAWDPSATDVYQSAWDALPKPTTIDIAAAKALIAGNPNAEKPINLAILAGDQTEIDTATLIQQEAATIGLTVNIQQVQPLAFSSAFFDPEARKGMDFLLTQGFLDVKDPLDYLGLIVNADSLFNFTHYDNPEVTKLITTARSTYDDKARAELVTQAQALYEKEHVVIPMLSMHESLFMNKKVTGAPASFAYIFEPSLASVGSAP